MMNTDRSFNTGDISNWNTRAMNLLQQGDTTAAVSILRGAIRSLSSHVRSTRKTKQAVRGPFTIETAAIRSVSVVPEGWGGVSDEIFTLFPRAFEVSSAVLNSEDYDSCGRILLYNMALAMDIQAHWFAKANDTESAVEWTKRAISIYEAALHTGRESAAHQGNSTSVNVVVLATINNLGRLQSRRHCFQETKDCLRLSLEIFRRLAEEGNCPVDCQLPFQSIVPFMWLNDMVLTCAPVA